MQPGDIVETTRDLHFIDDELRAGTRLRIIHVRFTNAGSRFSAIEEDGTTHHNIPGEDLKWVR